MADYWIVEKEYIHKLFKVLVPRFSNFNTCYTKLYRAPTLYPDTYPRAVLELKGNPYPSLLPDMFTNRNLIHNVLLDEAKRAYRARKYEEIAAKIDATEEKLNDAVQESPVRPSPSDSSIVDDVNRK